MGGAGEKTVRNWETGLSAPDATALTCLADKGGDVLYVVTGRRAPHHIGESSAAIPLTPIQKALNRLSTLDLSESDADLLLMLARRMTKRGR